MRAPALLWTGCAFSLFLAACGDDAQHSLSPAVASSVADPVAAEGTLAGTDVHIECERVSFIALPAIEPDGSSARRTSRRAIWASCIMTPWGYASLYLDQLATRHPDGGETATAVGSFRLEGGDVVRLHATYTAAPSHLPESVQQASVITFSGGTGRFVAATGRARGVLFLTPLGLGFLEERGVVRHN